MILVEMLNKSPDFEVTQIKPLTVRELILRLQEIPDSSTPVYLESGEPVHYTCHGFSKTETKFFIGVM
jgi:hypothetical protein